MHHIPYILHEPSSALRHFCHCKMMVMVNGYDKKIISWGIVNHDLCEDISPSLMMTVLMFKGSNKEDAHHVLVSLLSVQWLGDKQVTSGSVHVEETLGF